MMKMMNHGALRILGRIFQFLSSQVVSTTGRNIKLTGSFERLKYLAGYWKPYTKREQLIRRDPALARLEVFVRKSK